MMQMSAIKIPAFYALQPEL